MCIPKSFRNRSPIDQPGPSSTMLSPQQQSPSNWWLTLQQATNQQVQYQPPAGRTFQVGELNIQVLAVQTLQNVQTPAPEATSPNPSFVLQGHQNVQVLGLQPQRIPQPQPQVPQQSTFNFTRYLSPNVSPQQTLANILTTNSSSFYAPTSIHSSMPPPKIPRMAQGPAPSNPPVKHPIELYNRQLLSVATSGPSTVSTLQQAAEDVGTIFKVVRDISPNTKS